MPETANDFIIYSKVIVNGGKIPAKYTCDGEDISPQLAWTGAPAGTMSYVLIVDDPDAPGKELTHWVVYNLPYDMAELEEGMEAFEIIKKGSSQGKNDFGMQGYGGPCPPRGQPHRYRFRMYALDTMLDLPSGVTKNNVLSLMKKHIIAETEIIGLYKRA